MGIEWIILPFALIFLTFVDLIPRSILKHGTPGEIPLLPRSFELLLWVHWFTPLALIVPAVLWKLGHFSADVLALAILVVYIGTGIALTALSMKVRIRVRRAE